VRGATGSAFCNDYASLEDAGVNNAADLKNSADLATLVRIFQDFARTRRLASISRQGPIIGCADIGTGAGSD
jgi:hypothetical protein